MEKLKLDLQRFNDAEFVGLLSQGTVLTYRPAGGSAWITVAGVRSVPDIGTTPEAVDATDLSSDRMQSIAGLESSENLEFTIKYKATRFAEFNALAGTREPVEMRVTYPDGGGFDMTGQVFIRMSAAEVNGLLESVLTVVVNIGPDYFESASAASNPVAQKNKQ